MAKQQVPEVQERSASWWTYADVLALAMAHVGSKGENTWFVADPARWQRVVAKELLPLLERRHAGHLLEDVSFDRRRPEAPYSEQVDAFFRVMSRAGALSLLNPSFRIYEMKPRTKASIINHQGGILREYDTVVEEMAKVIGEKLSVPEPASNQRVPDETGT